MDLVGKCFDSNNSGRFTVLRRESSRRVLIKFNDTGYERFVHAVHVKTGEIKDKLKPSIHGVGCIGDGEFGTTGKFKSIYARYKHMIERCYVEGSDWYGTYGGVGIYVSDSFLNYQNYAKWFVSKCEEIGECPYTTRMQVDKDKSGLGFYGEESCTIISPQENSELSNSKKYTFQDEKGKVYKVFNMQKFCRERGLDASSMVSMCKGKLVFSQGFSRVGKFRKPSSSPMQCGLRGVIWSSRGGKWESRITVSGEFKHLGIYDDMFEAICSRKSEEARNERIKQSR